MVIRLIYSVVFIFVSSNLYASSCKKALEGKNSIDRVQEAYDPYTSIPDFSKIKLRDLLPSIQENIQGLELRVKEISESPEAPNFKNTIYALEFMEEKPLASQYLEYVHPTRETRYLNSVSEKQQALSASFIQNKYLGNEKLFARIKTVYENREKENLNSEEMELVEKIYKSFVEGGALFSAEQKAKVIQLQSKLTALQNKFSSNLNAYMQEKYVLVENREDLDGLSDPVISSAKEAAAKRNLDGYIFTPTPMNYLKIVSNAKSRDLREKIYRLYGNRAYDEHSNRDLASEIVSLKHQLANLYGFNSVAERSIADKSAPSVQAVTDFLVKLASEVRPLAKVERENLLRFAKSKAYSEAELKPWDTNYYLELLKKEKYSVNTEYVREHLEYNRVFSVMSSLIENLYGIKIIERKDLKSYHPWVQNFELKRGNKSLGFLMVDLFERNNKSSGAWANQAVVSHTSQTGKRVLGYGGINLNLTKPKKGEPLLLTYDNTVTLFHEMGHFLDLILSRAELPSMAGFLGAWDMIELPSQFFELFVGHPEVLSKMAIHHKTGKPLPKDVIQKVIDSEKLFAANYYLRQIGLATLDMKIYTEGLPKDVDLLELENQYTKEVALSEAMYPMSQIFSHIMAGGYSAGYYSYLWAEVYAKAAFQFFEGDGINNTEKAKLFEENVLAPGNTKRIVELFHKFHPEAVDPRSLIKDINTDF